MLVEKVDLYEYFSLPRPENGQGFITVYCRKAHPELGAKKRPAVVIAPGGCYFGNSERESEPVALRFLAAGFTSFVLNYTCHTAYPVPLVEAAMAMAYVRENADRYDVSRDRVCAAGFSAGGHLIGMLGTLYSDVCVTQALGERAGLVRPDAVILSYPVVTSDERFRHADSIETISGGDKALGEFLSLENRVTKDDPPFFVWHTGEDDVVPVENALRFAAACRKAGVPFELHIFEKGRHGLSVASAETEVNEQGLAEAEHTAVWADLALTWLKKRGFAVRFL